MAKRPAEVDRRTAKRQTRAERQADRVQATLDARNPTWPSDLLARALSLAIHSVTLGLVGLAGWVLVATFPSWLGLLLAALLLFIAWGLRPRLGDWDEIHHLRTRTDLPGTFALLDDLGEALDAPPVDGVVLDLSWNLSTRTVGWRRRTLITIGAPLWVALSRAERQAVLSHELAHGVNGDHRRTVLNRTALLTLGAWARVLHPGSAQAFHARTRGGFDALGYWAQRGAVRLVLAVQGGLLRLTRRQSARAEHLADRLAARVAGSAHLVSAFGVMALEGPARAATVAAARHGDDPWEAERRVLASLPPSERARLARQRDVLGDRTDPTHPRTSRRIAVLTAESSAGDGPAVIVDPERWAAVDIELAPDLDRLARTVRNLADPVARR